MSSTSDVSGSALVERLCRLCLPHTGADGAGVSLVAAAGNVGTVCSTDPTAARLEELQFVLGEGPCIDAVAAGAPVLVPDLHDGRARLAGRWPGFLESVDANAVRALFAFPLQIGAISLGAMDLYRRLPGELDARQLRSALEASDAVARALLAQDRPESAGLPGDTRHGASYRLEVHQAAGMVTVQLGVTIEEALAVLRATAYAQDQHVDDLAADVVAGRVRFPVEDA